MNQPLATWNPEKDYWETPNMDLFGHSAAYSAILPKSGMTRNGQLYESANWEDATTAPASSSSHILPTPVASPSGNTPENHLQKKPGRKTVTDLSILVENGLMQSGGKLLPTPAASDFKRHEESPADSQRKSPGITAVSVHFPEGHQYLPTPDAGMGTRGAAKSTETLRPSGARRQIKLNDLPTMLPTPNTMDSLPVREGEAREKQLRRGDMNAPKRRFMGNLREDIVHETHAEESIYGVYEAAVHRWEQGTRPAPAPTEPNSKGKPRLNAAFAEWMMGLPEGWVTNPEIGLTRAEQLKAIGNGVCPQQATAALTHLLERTA